MERNGSWLRAVVVLTCLVAASGARELGVRSKAHKAIYNHTLATILVEYASAVYMSDLTELFSWTCPRCDGKTKGFEVIELIVDIQHCLQAYVGVAKDLNAVVIAFRGTQEHSIQNWVEDLYWKQHDINYPGMPGAMVHRGFYYAYHNTTIRPGILDAVIRAKDLYGDINVMVTGHSMGGAMASFCGLDLVCLHLTTVTACQIRYVLLMDMILCLICLRTILGSHRRLTITSLERSVTGNSLADHLVYYGVGLMAETWGSCKIVMDARLKEYGGEDVKGNLIVSRNLSASALRLPSDSDAKNNFS
ncbi:lipase-like isoform X5 [Syzygium oleosum]|uniref:lipase-like isoform X5 n=1 Tax=Syzygium oleosum TaxID=219896 RepID=UPI0024B97ED4|nr:lipase-like isoform X5 [Syzygium oleosum]